MAQDQRLPFARRTCATAVLLGDERDTVEVVDDDRPARNGAREGAPAAAQSIHLSESQAREWIQRVCCIRRRPSPPDMRSHEMSGTRRAEMTLLTQ